MRAFPSVLKNRYRRAFLSAVIGPLLILLIMWPTFGEKLAASLQLNTAMRQFAHLLLSDHSTILYDLTSTRTSSLTSGSVAPLIARLSAAPHSPSPIVEKALATIYFAGGMIPQALQVIEKLEMSAPLSDLDYLKHGFIQERAGLVDQAMLSWQKTQAFQDGYFLKQGDLALRQDEREKAKRYYDVALRGIPDVRVFTRLSGLHIIIGESALAREFAIRALEAGSLQDIRDTLVDLTRLVDGRFVWVYILLAQIAEAEGDAVSAGFWYQAATSAVESPLTLYHEGVFYCQVAQFPAGIERLQTAIQRDPADYYSIQSNYRLIDTCYCPGGDLSTALEAAKVLVLAQPNDATALALLNRLQAEGGQMCRGK